MELWEKCQAIGLECHGLIEGWPSIERRIIREIDGTWKAFIPPHGNPWESETEDESFSSATLLKVKDLNDGTEDNLTAQEISDLADAQQENTDKLNNQDPLVLKAIYKFLMASMEQYYNNPPANGFLDAWVTWVDNKFPGDKPWD